VQEVYGSDTSIGGKRFGSTHADPAWRFEVKEDGVYRLEVRDLFGTTRSDPRNVYRLAIRRESPDFHLLAIVEPPPIKDDDRAATPRAASIRGGGTIALKLLAFRRDNFAGDIELTAEDLPTGVTCSPTKILAGRNDGLLLLTADEAAAPWVGAIRVRGRARIGEQEIAREARGGAVCWSVSDSNENPVPARLTRDFALAVTGEKAPVSVAPAEDKIWEVAPGGKLEIPLAITRRGEFKETLKLKAVGAPGLEAFKELEIGGSVTAATATLELSALKLPEGAHTIYFHGQTKGKFRGKDVTAPIYTPTIRLVVKAPEKT